MTQHDADVAIIGAGAAGLIAALNARGRRVLVITPERSEGEGAASDLAQGGLAAAVGRDDSPSLHLCDTLEAAGAETHIAAARHLCREAPGAIAYLESLGVHFAREGARRSLHTEAAHSRARVLHMGDATGAALMAGLRRAVAVAAHIEYMPCTRAISLLRNARGVCGVAALTEDGRPVLIRSRAVVIATGGVGGLFARSTNPIGACGDGIAMAIAAGARCAHLEFVQFHPTALDVDTQPLPLLTEALRGAGARLIDEDGRPVTAEAHPLGDLAPRDVVARAVYAAQMGGRRVLLDATRLNCDVSTSFPGALRRCAEYGVDLRCTPAPVTPAVHYFMGGVAVDLDGRTSLPGLWAVGEAACTGAHGANRLASNSLLEAVVFGRRVGRALVRDGLAPAPPRETLRLELSHVSEHGAGRELREVMWRCMGVVRNAARISEGLAFIARLREQTPPLAHLKHARLALAEAMLIAAARRTHSCGAHFRSDAPAALAAAS